MLFMLELTAQFRLFNFFYNVIDKNSEKIGRETTPPCPTPHSSAMKFDTTFASRTHVKYQTNIQDSLTVKTIATHLVERYLQIQ